MLIAEGRPALTGQGIQCSAGVPPAGVCYPFSPWFENRDRGFSDVFSGMERAPELANPEPEAARPRKEVPSGRATIAQRLIAGIQASRNQVPSGTKEKHPGPGWRSNSTLSSLRDSFLLPATIPAMNRWATFYRPPGWPACDSTQNSEEPDRVLPTGIPCFAP